VAGCPVTHITLHKYAVRMAARQFAFSTFHAPFGEITVVASDKGVHNVMFDATETPRNLQNDELVENPRHPVVKEAVSQLKEYFAGKRTKFDLKLDLEGTEFQVAAWKALATVPYAKTASYATQAARIKRPTATRAVGAANGRNPVAIVLPCHRIVGANGSLTGFAGGLVVKQWLLDHEQKVAQRSK